jgi:hypothetical protein
MNYPLRGHLNPGGRKKNIELPARRQEAQITPVAAPWPVQCQVIQSFSEGELHGAVWDERPPNRAWMVVMRAVLSRGLPDGERARTQRGRPRPSGLGHAKAVHWRRQRDAQTGRLTRADDHGAVFTLCRAASPKAIGEEGADVPERTQDRFRGAGRVWARRQQV